MKFLLNRFEMRAKRLYRGLFFFFFTATVLAFLNTCSLPTKSEGEEVNRPADTVVSEDKDEQYLAQPAELEQKEMSMEKVRSRAAPSPLMKSMAGSAGFAMDAGPVYQPFNTEEYDHIEEAAFKSVKDHPLSTFSIDVDTASYSNVRRFLNDGSLPPQGAVRIEEMINYFDYTYKGPEDQKPFATHTAVTKAPWNDDHFLVRVALKGKEMKSDKVPPRNLVFLLDVSGSMESPDKLPLLKQALKLLTNQLNEKDTVSIVVYAGSSGLALEPTKGNQKGRIIESMNNLQAGGSTNGAEGIELAYRTAKAHFVRDGINRVILATDGDFNVGVTSRDELIRLIEKKRKEGIYLTVLGFGTGNVKDSTMEQLADKGNGNYAYIDTIHEANKVLVKQAGSTLVTIAKDVKIQVEFNPRIVDSYRLIGYENRALQDEDFNDDKKDAGEIGAGHTVTALYEVVPISEKSAGKGNVDPLKYQSDRTITDAAKKEELLTVKLRYKDPHSDTSKLLTYPVAYNVKNIQEADDNFRMAAAVAAFGMTLRKSENRGKANYNMALALARSVNQADDDGYRSEFISLIHKAKNLSK